MHFSGLLMNNSCDITNVGATDVVGAAVWPTFAALMRMSKMSAAHSCGLFYNNRLWALDRKSGFKSLSQVRAQATEAMAEQEYTIPVFRER